MPLIAGTYYQFKVQARNEVGFSEFSEVLSVYAAQVPDTPAAPTTTRVDDNIVIDWVAPNEQGSAISGYRI